MFVRQIQNFEYMFNAWERFLFEKSNAVVLSDSLGNRFTRTQVNDISGRIYAYLEMKGIGKEDFVLINLDRSVKPILAILGVLKNGSAFVVTETSYPEERKKFIYDDCKAKFEINEDNWNEIIETKPLTGFEIADSHDACFCVFTSGTTGTPKGVVHEYGQIKLEMLSEQTAPGEWRENTDTKWGLIAPLNFVASIKIIIHFLYSGSHLHVLDYNTAKDPRKLNAYFLKNRINGTFLSPSMLRKYGSNLGPFMKLVYTGSENASNVFIKGVELLNIYTMSESMFTVTRFLIDEPYNDVPIGSPTFDLPIKLIDATGRQVADGETGEMCFYNPYCRGYINNKAENDKHFCGGWFHTGDLAVFKNGRYYLKGRIDDMLKINGNRVEPFEIESACRKLLNVSECAAKVFEEGFVAFYYTDVINFDEDDIRKKLEKMLPYYMVPSYFIRLEKMPLTDGGKIDKKHLNIPADFYKAEYQAPRNIFEKKLTKAFSKVLCVEKIGILDDFFQMGGSSIKVMELLSILDEDDILTPTLIYKGRTIEKIHQLYLAEKANHLTVEEKEREGRKHKYPLSDNALWYWKNVNDASIDFYTALKFSAFIPLGVIVKRLNNYISNNSTFNMVLEAGENGIPLQAYTPNTPYIKLEHITKTKLESLKTNFVRPFGFGEPLIRLRAYRCGMNTYVFIHAFHMVTDGAGFHLLLEDLTKCLMGKETEIICYLPGALKDSSSRARALARQRITLRKAEMLFWAFFYIC